MNYYCSLYLWGFAFFLHNTFGHFPNNYHIFNKNKYYKLKYMAKYMAPVNINVYDKLYQFRSVNNDFTVKTA